MYYHLIIILQLTVSIIIQQNQMTEQIETSIYIYMYLLPLIIITITNLPYPLLLLNPTNKGIECVHRKLNNMLVITPTR